MNFDIQIHWQTSELASCLHTAQALLRSQSLADAALAEALARPVAKLAAACREEYVAAEQFMMHLVPRSASNANLAELVEVALIKTIGRTETPSRLRRFRDALRGINTAFHVAFPDAALSLPGLIGPVKQKWDYHWRSLMAGLVNWTDPDILVSEATIVVIHPAQGGGGTAYLPYNVALIEGVADDPGPLPEVLHLAWLIAQLNLDLPAYSEHIRRDLVTSVAGLAMLPLVLTVAEELQLARCDPETISYVVQNWVRPLDKQEQLTTTVLQWWEVYRSLRPGIATGLKALEQLIAV